MSPLFPAYATRFAPQTALQLDTSGEEIFSRLLVASGGVSSATGRLRLTYWTARKTEPITQVRMVSGTTAAAATPTVCRMGIYLINAAGDGTSLVASTANDVTLFAGANTEYTKALQATFNKAAGQVYASASIVVTAAAAPTLCGLVNPGGMAASYGRQPIISMFLDGQADLPANFTFASLTASANAIYQEMVP